MRGLKSTIALIAVLAGLGAYIYFVTLKLPDEGAGEKKEKVFPAFAADKVDDLRVKTDAGEVTTLKKDANGWQIVTPVAAHAAESEVTGITIALGNLEIVKVIDENPTDLKQYGLDGGQTQIVFKSPDDKSSGRLLIGLKTAASENVYAKRNDEKRVFLVAAFQQPVLNKSTFDLRDKSLLTFERDKVDAVDVMAGTTAIQLAKDGGAWKMTKPLAVKADFSAVEGAVIGRVATAQMQSVVTDQATPAELKQYGLDKPSLSVTFGVGPTHTTLAFGGKSPAGTVYARDASKPVVMTVEAALADDLRKGPDEYRPKSVFEFRAFTLTHIEVAKGGQTLTLERVKGQGATPSDSWRRVSPNPAAVDTTKAENFITGLADLNIASFESTTAKTGLDKPIMTVDAKYDEGKKDEKATFGKNGADTFVARPGEPGAGKLTGDQFDAAIKAFDELLK